MGLLQSLHPDEWENLCERLGTQPTAPIGHLRANEQVEVQAWASDRSQVLSRTVRGVMKYGDALRVLAREEGGRARADPWRRRCLRLWLGSGSGGGWLCDKKAVRRRLRCGACGGRASWSACGSSRFVSQFAVRFTSC